MTQAEPATDGRARATVPVDSPPAPGRAPDEGSERGGTGLAGAAGSAGKAALAEETAWPAALPPGQHIPRVWPVMHYGPVPTFRPETWDLRVYGATACGGEVRWDWAAVSAIPRVHIVADMHCVTKFTITDVAWEGIAATELLELAPPAPEVTHVMVWAEYGYSANLPIGVFADDLTLLATHRDGAQLTPEHGYPVRLVVPRRYAWKSVKWVRAVEYLTRDRRGFWEERGYHNSADPWREQRFSYQEEAGEGPPL